MGILFWKVLGEPTMIRIAIVVCCATLAAAEGMFYNSYQPGYSTYRFPNAMRGYGAPLPPNSYSGHYGFPGYQAGFGAPVGAYQPFGYATGAHIAKREAEAEPEAEANPTAFYNSFYSSGYNMAYSPYHYPAFYSSSHYQPSHNNLGYGSFFGKREAEAEPAAVYGQHGFYNPAYNTYTTGFPSFGSFYSGYRNFYQPSYYGGYGHF